MQVSAKSLAWDIIVGGVWGIRKACSPKIVTEWQGKGTKGTAGGRGRGDGRAEPSVVREKHYDRRSLINMNVVDNSEFTVSLKAHLEYDINYSKVICLIYIMSSLFPLSHWLYFKVPPPNTITLGVGISTWILGCHKHSDQNTYLIFYWLKSHTIKKC